MHEYRVEAVDRYAELEQCRMLGEKDPVGQQGV